MTAPDSRLWTDTDRDETAELLRDRIESLGMTFEAATEELLDQLVGEGWRKAARPGCSCPTAGVMVQPGCSAHAYRGGADDGV